MPTMAFDREMHNQVSRVKLLPSLVNSRRMLEIINDKTFSPEELESIISYDSSLAANLVMTGNESCYGYRGKVGTLSRAMAVLGMNQVKWTCAFSLMMKWLVNESAIGEAYREMLWKHSYMASKIAVEIAEKRPWVRVDEAFLLGLLYDIGWQIMAVRFDEQFKAIFEFAARTRVPPWWVEVRYGLSHTEIGRYLAAQRALPESFQAVAAFHHCPEKSSLFNTEVTFICLVDVLVHSREYPGAVNDELTLARCRRLFIAEDEWNEYQQSLERIGFEADQLWMLLH